MNIKEGSLKVFNDEFMANVEWLDITLKLAQADFQGESQMSQRL